MKLKEPKKPKNIPKNSHWLSGIGAGSWFVISKENNQYRIKRYSDEGVLECSKLFKTKNTFNINEPFTFTYISHCMQCTVLQKNHKIKFYTNEH